MFKCGKDRNCPLKTPVVEERYAHDILPHTFDIRVFNCDKDNFTAIKHISYKSANLSDSYDVAFDTND